jgi:16S rRNA (guanine527-N7)-methyltransferase
MPGGRPMRRDRAAGRPGVIPRAGRTADPGAGRRHLIRTLDVSCETVERLDAFAAELTRWNAAVNLVSPASLPDLWTRHILDSAQVLRFAPATARRWRDIGSGGGFPGLVVAILATEQRPDLAMTLVESDRRKAAFLAAAARAAGVAPEILTGREDDLPATSADVVSARAVAPLPVLLGWAHRHLAPDGRALFPKGARHRAECQAALASWRFEVHNHRSLSGDGAILDISRIAPAPPPGTPDRQA